MIFAIIIVIAIVIAIFTTKDYICDWYEYIIPIFVAIALGALIGLLSTLIATCIVYCLPEEAWTYTEVNDHELVALVDNTQLWMYRYCGSERPTYNYIYETPMGRTMDSKPANEVYVRDCAPDEMPHIAELNGRYADWFHSLFPGSEKTKYIVWLPEGSVIEDVYSIDMETK